jgi:hypothetical protein
MGLVSESSVVSRRSSVVRAVLCASVDMVLGVRQDWCGDKEAPLSASTRRYTYADLLETPDGGVLRSHMLPDFAIELDGLFAELTAK